MWRSAMMSAWHIAPVNSGSWTEQQLASVKRAVHIYKQWIRPILRDAKVHHILPRPDGVNWDGMFYWSPSLKAGTVYIFRPDSPEGRKMVKLKGLEPRRNYRLWCEDGSISAGVRRGDELMSKGIEVSLPDSYTRDLIYIEAESSTARRAT